MALELCADVMVSAVARWSVLVGGGRRATGPKNQRWRRNVDGAILLCRILVSKVFSAKKLML